MVDGNVDELDKEANSAHDGESNANSPANGKELLLRWLRAAVDELCTLL